MIIGECPYCDGTLILSMSEIVPSWTTHNCDICGKLIYTYNSRLDPTSYTEEGFKEAGFTLGEKI